MAKTYIFVVIFISLLAFSQPVHGAKGHLYTNEIKSYQYFDGETFRRNSKNEFVVQDYWFNTVNTTTEFNRTVTIFMTDDTQHGSLHNVTQNVYHASFSLVTTDNYDGSLQNIDFKWMMFREPIADTDPFLQSEAVVLTNGDNRRFDMENTASVFSVALQYYEYHFIDGSFQKIKVNTELNSDVYKDGRLKRLGIHIVKRNPDGNVIYDYNQVVEEVVTLYRLFNHIDQPWLWVPVIIAIPFTLIYIYIRIMRYIKKYGIKVIKTTNLEDTSVDIDPSENTDK